MRKRKTTILVLILLTLMMTACSSTTPTSSIKKPNWTNKPKTLYSDYNCGSEHKRWLEYNGFQALDSYGYGGVMVKYLVSKKGKYYTILFSDIKDIGDYEVWDEEPKKDELQKGCSFIKGEEYIPKR